MYNIKYVLITKCSPPQFLISVCQLSVSVAACVGVGCRLVHAVGRCLSCVGCQINSVDYRCWLSLNNRDRWTSVPGPVYLPTL